MSTPSPLIGDTPPWDLLRRRSLIVAAASAGVFLIFAVLPLGGPNVLTRAATAYLIAFTAWLAFPLGCLVVLMIQYLTGGAWGVLLRPVLEAGARTLYLLALLALPLVLTFFMGTSSPYPWARPIKYAAHDEVLQKITEKTRLLNPDFVTIRLAIYFALWLLLVHFLTKWSARWRAGDASSAVRLPTISGPGLVIYGITISLAAIDWVMSIEPFWRSTMYPGIYAVGQILSGFALATASVILLSAYPPLAGRVTPKLLRDLGGLLLAFVMIWAYVSFSQFMLIWIGNLPDETSYYIKRFRGGWDWVGFCLIVAHFALPFAVLLFRKVKECSSALLRVVALVLLMRFIDVIWWIEPAFQHTGLPVFLIVDIAAILAVGGVWSWWFLGQLSKASLVPVFSSNQCEPRAIL